MSWSVFVRVVLELLVMGLCGLWLASLRHDWHVFTRRARRVSVAIFGVLVANAFAILVAITNGRPLTAGTWGLIAAFSAANIALLLRFPNDNSTDRQYAHLFHRR